MKMKPEVKVELLEMEDPTFDCGSLKTAKARLTNPTAKQFTYTTELYLGVAKVATSGTGSVTIVAGGYADVSYQITMPATEGIFDVYLDVWQAGALLAHYKAVESVTTVITPAIEVGPITWV